MSLKINIAAIVTGLAEYYEKVLTDSQLDMYVEDLLDIPPSELIEAVKLYRKDSRNDRFPLPSKLRAMIQPPDDQRARDAAGLILTGISRIGHYRTKDAQVFVGELAWEIVKLQGGWEEVCKTVTDDNKGILQAQWRELGIALINKNRLGIMDMKPALEFKRGGLTALGGITKEATKELPEPEPSHAPIAVFLKPVEPPAPVRPKISDDERKLQIAWLTETNGKKPFDVWQATRTQSQSNIEEQIP